MAGLCTVPDRPGGAPGKLTAAGRAWALGDTLDTAQAVSIDADLAAQFAALGVAVDIETDEEDDGVTEVWDSNWPAVWAFLSLDTQWRKVARGMSGVMSTLGLDYAAADVVLRRQNAGPDVFDDLRVIERAALEALAERVDD